VQIFASNFTQVPGSLRRISDPKLSRL